MNREGIDLAQVAHLLGLELAIVATSGGSILVPSGRIRLLAIEIDRRLIDVGVPARDLQAATLGELLRELAIEAAREASKSPVISRSCNNNQYGK